jgi:hypothetical protein
LQNSVVSVSYKDKCPEKLVDKNVFILYYQNQQEEYYNFIAKEGKQQIRRIIVRFTPDSIEGIANRLCAGCFGVQIQAVARN